MRPRPLYRQDRADQSSRFSSGPHQASVRPQIADRTRYGTAFEVAWASAPPPAAPRRLAGRPRQVDQREACSRSRGREPPTSWVRQRHPRGEEEAEREPAQTTSGDEHEAPAPATGSSRGDARSRPTSAEEERRRRAVRGRRSGRRRRSSRSRPRPSKGRRRRSPPSRARGRRGGAARARRASRRAARRAR